jgi:hypothetical protein
MKKRPKSDDYTSKGQSCFFVPRVFNDVNYSPIFTSSFEVEMESASNTMVWWVEMCMIQNAIFFLQNEHHESSWYKAW